MMIKNKISMSSTRLAQLAIYLLLVFTSKLVYAQKLSLYDLKVEYQDTPLSVETSHPRFSWKLYATLKNTLQKSYEVRVGEDSASLVKGKNILWHDKSNTAQSVHIKYAGPELEAGSNYFWQVRIADNHGNNSGWSKVRFWQMGLKPADWTANWISVPGLDTSDRSPLFRTEFNIKKKIKKAVAYITAKGLYEAFINGKRVSNNYFAPGWTSYKKRLQYQVYDVTSAFATGFNAIGVTLGDGWYSGHIGFGDQHNFYGDTRALLMQIEITFSDGTKDLIQTDDTWKTSYGPILSSDIYHGETYDSRLEQDGWTKKGFIPAIPWQQVKILADGKNELVSMIGPPVTMHEHLNVVKLIRSPKGETILDFGQNMVGWVKFKVSGSAGTRITLSHAEVLDKQGNFYTANLRSAKAQNHYILNGAAEQIFEPHFTFQGFRYVKLEGFPGTVDTASFTAIVIHSDMKQTGKFNTSNPELNQLQHNILWGQKGNFLDVPTDCPQRNERLGWIGDAQAFYRTAAYNMDVAGFFSKWLKDLASDQLPDGSVTHVVPHVMADWESGSSGWGDAATIVPWGMYVAYGDRQILEEQYGSMKAWVEYIKGRSQNGLWKTGRHFGDWLFYAPGDDLDGKAAVTNKFLIAQTFYAHSIQLLINAAEILEREDDAAHYKTLLAEVKAAFVSEYLTANGKLVSGTQTAYVLALQFDMLPEQFRLKAAQELVDNVKSYGNHLTTGFLGTPYLCHVLTRFGHTDVAYALLLQDSYPSWLYPVKMGATTIWERWDGIKPDGSFQNESMNSFNHYAYGAIGDWMYRTVTGITSDESAVGYKRIIIKPEPGGRISHAAAELMTSYGTVKSSWKIANGVFKLDVVIPANTTATIILPNGATEKIGSGDYHFESRLKPES